MMNTEQMQAPFIPKKLVEKSYQLNIPIYQRLFVWETSQIEQLFSDLQEAYEKSPDAPYYIGIITLVNTGNRGTWDIVDGQQRLTFLTLLGAYINDGSWQNFIYSNGGNKKLRIQFTGRPEDEQDIENIINGNNDAVKNQNFRMFLDCARKREITEKLSNFIYENASFLISELPGEYSPVDLNRFFEKMNAAGRQLTPVEQIKGKYFPSHADEFDACLNFEERFMDPGENTSNNDAITLQAILEDVTTQVKPEEPETISVNRYANRSILRPAVFLLHVLRLLNDSNISLNENKLLDTFKDHTPNAQDFIKKMKAYRQWMDDNIIYIKYSDSDYFDYSFRAQDDKKEELPENDKEKKLLQFQSMLYVSSSNAQNWVLEAYRETQDQQNVSLDLLKKQDSERHSRPDEMSYPSIDRYWFWKLDYLLWEKMIDKDYGLGNYELSAEEQKAIKNYKFRPNRSIEHLHPQNPKQELSDWKEDKENVRNGFGNLAMISSSFNSAQSNDSLATKFGRVKDQVSLGRLESIKMLLMFRLAEGLESKWTTETAKNHGQEMHDLLKNNKVSYDEKF